MKEINFNSKGDPLKIRFYVENGVLAAAYWIKLSEKNSNAPVMEKSGDNQNPEDDTYYLPVPVADNDGRLIRLTVDFYGLDISVSKTYKIVLEVYQGEVFLDSIGGSGPLTGGTQSLLLFCKLKAN